MVGRGSSSGGEEEGFTGRAVIGYDHGYDGEIFYLSLALDEKSVEGSLDRSARTIREEGSPRLTGDPQRLSSWVVPWDDPINNAGGLACQPTQRSQRHTP
jgi:hypothetical protein